MSIEVSSLSTDFLRPYRGGAVSFAGDVAFDSPPDCATPAHVTDDADATSSTTGSVTCAGGVGVSKRANVGAGVACGGSATVPDGGVSCGGDASVAGRLTCGGALAAPNGGMGVAGDARVAGTAAVAGALSCSGGATVSAATVVSGALSVVGGLTMGGVGAAEAFVGGDLSAASGSVSGALAASAGATVAKDASASGAATFAGELACAAAADSSSKTTGAIVASGGARVGGTLTLGRQLELDGGAPRTTRCELVWPTAVSGSYHSIVSPWLVYRFAHGATWRANFAVPADCERGTPVVVELRMFLDAESAAGEVHMQTRSAWCVDGGASPTDATVVATYSAAMTPYTMHHVVAFSGNAPATPGDATLALQITRESDSVGDAYIACGVARYASGSWGGESATP